MSSKIYDDLVKRVVQHYLKSRDFNGYPLNLFLNIKPFFGIVFAITQPVMPASWLKFPFLPTVFEAELTFPVGNPYLDGELQIPRRTERVQMVRHEQVITHQPRLCFRPSLVEQAVHCFVGQPRFTLIGTDGEQDDVRLPQLNVNTRSRILALRKFFLRRMVHMTESIGN